MHYRHSFHAGNFADVFKHVFLVGLLQALGRKDKPWSFLDTHAGAGDYDLGSEVALRTGEWHEGIERLLGSENGLGHGLEHVPEPLATYLALVRDANPDGGLRHYPGSPRFAQKLARPGDRLVLCEREPEVAEALKFGFRNFANTTVHVRDGYEAHALLPPPEKRGLVLIDPPFERADEFDAASDFVARAAPRYAGGVFAVWYPLKQDRAAERLLRRLARDGGRPVLDLRLDTGMDATPREVMGRSGRRLVHPMTGCGLAVVGPPFGFEAQARETLALLAPRLAQGLRPSWSAELVTP